MIDKEKFSRQIILDEVGIIGQKKLQGFSVLVIGAGGLGCPLLIALTRAGVGRVGIVDDDIVDLSNIHRQTLYDIKDIGKRKTEIAKIKLKQYSKDIKIEIYTERFNNKNALSLVEKYNIIIDGSDNFDTKYLVNDSCIIKNKPFIIGSIYKFTCQIGVFNYKNSASYRCIFTEPPEKDQVPNCNQIGVMPTTTLFAGSVMANETIKLILEIGTPLINKIFIIDLLKNLFEVIEYDKNPKNFEIKKLPELNFNCENNKIYNHQLTKEHYLVDVRESYEHKLDKKGNLNIPLSELKNRISEIPKNKKIVFFCESGFRSKQANKIFKNSLVLVQ